MANVDTPITTDEDTAVSNINVLVNDTDADGDTLTVTDAVAENGTVTISVDGTLNYMPNSNYNGSDTITYTISDGAGGTDTATVEVTVNPVNDPLTFSMSAPAAFTEGSAAADDVVATVASASDPDGGAITYSISDTTNYAIDENTGDVTLTAAGAALANEDSGADLPAFTVTATSAGTYGSTADDSVDPSVTPAIDPSNLVLSGSSAIESTFIALSYGDTSFISDEKDGQAVVSNDGSAVTHNGGSGLIFVYVDNDNGQGSTLRAVDENDDTVVFEVRGTVNGDGVSGYTVEIFQPLDPVITTVSSSEAFTFNREESKTITLSTDGVDVSLTVAGRTASGEVADVNGSNQGGSGGIGVQTPKGPGATTVEDGESLIFTTSSPITQLRLQLSNIDGPNNAPSGAVVGTWVAYDADGLMIDSGTFTADETDLLITDSNGEEFSRVEITASAGFEFQVQNNSDSFEVGLNVPHSIDFSADIDGAGTGNEVPFTVTFDQLSSTDSTSASVDSSHSTDNTTLIASAEAETLVGLAGAADTFAWTLSDQQSGGDVIENFDASEDAIDLGDLLTGYNDGDDLSDFISVSYDSGSGNTVIEVSGVGDGNTTQTITVEGVDLTDIDLDGSGSIDADDMSILLERLRTGSVIDPDSGG